MNDADLRDLVAGCVGAASYLGHNVGFKGLFGPPCRLVTDATRRINEALRHQVQDGPTVAPTA